MARAARRPCRQTQIARLLVAAAALALAASACARQEPPPGGPPDIAPPKIVSVEPESGKIVHGWKGDAVIQFDEVIDEMPGVAGGASLERQVLLSPVTGRVTVEWHRSRVTVKPREGWKRRVYRLEVLPGIVDLRRNRLDTAKVVLFSTGPEIGHARIGGIALGWVEQRIIPRALIEAVPLPDSVGYLTLADSGGQFNLQGLAPGRYIVYATADENGDRRRGPREAYDSAMVTLDSSSNVALYAFVHDTTGPRIRAASAIDSLALRIEFSQPLDPTGLLDSTRVHVLELPDSVRIPVRQVIPQRQYDSLAAVARAKKDSAAAARDTAAARRRPPAPPAPPPPPPPPAAQQRKQAPVDTALVRSLLARRPIPSDRLVLTIGRPLKPETRYVIRVEDVANLIGKKGSGEVVLLVPKPPPPPPPRPPPPPPPPPPS